MTNLVHAPARRRGRPRNLSIDDLAMDAAVDLLVETGARSVTVDAISTRSGISRDAIYRRWPNAEDLLGAALDRVILAAAGRSHTGRPYSTDGMALDAAILQALRRFVSMFSDRRYAACYLALLTSARINPDQRPAFERHQLQFVERLAEVVAPLVAPHTVAPPVLAHLIVSTAIFPTLTALHPPTEDELRALSGIIYRGVITSP